MIYLHALSLVNALGSDRTTLLQNWGTGTSPGLTQTDAWIVGKIPAVFACVKERLPDLSERFPRENTRNNRLLALAWEKEKGRFSTLLNRHSPDRTKRLVLLKHVSRAKMIRSTMPQVKSSGILRSFCVATSASRDLLTQSVRPVPQVLEPSSREPGLFKEVLQMPPLSAEQIPSPKVRSTDSTAFRP